MKIFIEKNYKSGIISSIILLIFGLLLLFKSEETIVTISYIVGSVIIAMGVLAFINYFTGKDNISLSIAYGTISVVLGIIIISNPVAIASIIPIIIGVGVILNSAMKLQYSLELKNIESPMWKTTFAVALISTICGVVILFNPFKGAVVITQVIGIFLIIYAVVDIIYYFKIKKELKENIEQNFSKQVDVAVYDAEIVEEKKNKKSSIKKTKNKKTKKDKDNK